MISHASLLSYLEHYPREGLRKLRALSVCLERGQRNSSLESLLIEEDFSDEMIDVLLRFDSSKNKDHIEEFKSNGIGLVSLFDNEYPALLKTIPDPPIILYFKGDVTALDSRTMGVVGARHADRSGIQLAQECAEVCSSHGIAVVSGIALGIDGAAHVGALKARAAPTVAVLGSGVERCYPPSHQRIYEDIIHQGGAVISEYPPGTPPYPGNFLERNRIIAGMSQMLLVVQAAKRSGSLRTALAALEYGREVAALPWDIFNKRGEGCNKLLQRGAYVVTSIDDVLAQYGIERNGEQHREAIELSDSEKDILALFDNQKSMHIDEIRTKLVASELDITNLELLGLLKRNHGNMLSKGT